MYIYTVTRLGHDTATVCTTYRAFFRFSIEVTFRRCGQVKSKYISLSIVTTKREKVCGQRKGPNFESAKKTSSVLDKFKKLEKKIKWRAIN